eukprot:205176_1
MQDNPFDDYDYTLCTYCHSSIQPYNNISLTTIQQYTNNTPITLSTLSSTNPHTKNLLSHSHLHCSKCGLYIKIHPHNNDTTSIQKIFICSNYTTSHKYCLCYHCALLYGLNPNQKTINLIEIIQSQDKIHKESIEEEHSLEREVIDDKICSDDDSDTTISRMEQNKDKIDESYLHLIALQTKLNVLQNNKSCPASPTVHKESKLKHKTIPNWPMSHSHSLRASPLLGPKTPITQSPRVLGKDVDESEKKWKNILQQYKKERDIMVPSSDRKLKKQQRRLEELQKLQKELSLQKKIVHNMRNYLEMGYIHIKII